MQPYLRQSARQWITEVSHPLQLAKSVGTSIKILRTLPRTADRSSDAGSAPSVGMNRADESSMERSSSGSGGRLSVSTSQSSSDRISKGVSEHYPPRLGPPVNHQRHDSHLLPMSMMQSYLHWSACQPITELFHPFQLTKNASGCVSKRSSEHYPHERRPPVDHQRDDSHLL